MFFEFVSRARSAVGWRNRERAETWRKERDIADLEIRFLGFWVVVLVI
jgi:hypothetical protein